MRGFIHWYVDGVQLDKGDIMFSKQQQISLRFHFEKQHAGQGLDYSLSMLGNYKSEQTNALWHDYVDSPVAKAIVARIQHNN
jgi:hypothetical protein